MPFRYETLVGTIGKKFKNKRKRKTDSSSSEEEEEDTLEKRAKRGFIKPRTEADEFEF